MSMSSSACRKKTRLSPDTFYNSAAVVGPDGVIGSYAKIVPTGLEVKWCKRGKKPFSFDTPWGLIGVGICYDTYMFPELPRYYAALGARLYVHITALDSFQGWKEYYYNQLQARAIENMMFVASSNLAGRELSSNFQGNSLILGPGRSNHDIRYFARPMDENNEDIVYGDHRPQRSRQGARRLSPVHKASIVARARLEFEAFSGDA